MTKWILKWNDACGESNGEECIDSKEELKERIEEIKDEYTIEDLEWEAKKAEVCPCCKEWVIKGKVKKKNLLKEYAIDLKERDEQMKRQGAIDELNTFYGEVIDGRFSGLMILEKKALRDYVEKRLVELRKE